MSLRNVVCDYAGVDPSLGWKTVGEGLPGLVGRPYAVWGEPGWS